MKNKFKISKKKLMDFFFEEVTLQDLPEIIISWVISFLFIALIFWAITKTALYFHL